MGFLDNIFKRTVTKQNTDIEERAFSGAAVLSPWSSFLCKARARL